MRLMLYAPESLVSPTYGVPRAVSVAVTFAPLIGAPLGSETVPTIAAVTSWLHADCKVPVKVRNTRSEQKNAINDLLIAEPSSNEEQRTIGSCYIAERNASSRKKRCGAEVF